MEWVLRMCLKASSTTAWVAPAVGAAAASGDLARLAWLREHRFGCAPAPALSYTLQYADMRIVQQLEQAGGYLPPEGDAAWSSEDVVVAAAASSKDSTAKLRWLAGRGVPLRVRAAVEVAAGQGNLEALQLLLEQWGPQERADLLPAALREAVGSGSIPMVEWLQQYPGHPCPLDPSCLKVASGRGDRAMLRWLLQAGCPRDLDMDLAWVVHLWPSNTAEDGEQLAEAVRLLAAAGWQQGAAAAATSLQEAARHPRAVWCALAQLLPPNAQAVSAGALGAAAGAGCEATLEAIVEALGGGGAVPEHFVTAPYARAASNGDRGMLAALRRLRVPWGSFMLAEAVREGSSLPSVHVASGAGVPMWVHGGTRRATVSVVLPGGVPGPKGRGSRWRRGCGGCCGKSGTWRVHATRRWGRAGACGEKCCCWEPQWRQLWSGQ